jgi:hypothetical protein
VSTETTWCPQCQRQHEIVTCEDCQRELPPHYLIHLCDHCKGIRREVRKQTAGQGY